MGKWWSGMMNMRSYRAVVLLFAKLYPVFHDFEAVVETANQYPHADTHRVTQMLMDLNVIEINYKNNNVKYDQDHLIELLEYMMYE